MIAVIDYGMGNLASVQNALLKLGYEVFISNDKELIINADRVILPGVGAFEDAIKCLCDLGLDQTIKQVLRYGKPVLGICLGMQLIFSQSEENGLHTGLDLLPGRVVRFQLPPSYKVPHMGWNSIKPAQESRLFQGIDTGSYFYFVHSYYPVPEDSKVIAAQSEYGVNFTCAIEQDNLFATQFHPEKSGNIGLKVLKNFGEMQL
ncbi:imidazole glycerol phosphate synthase subunit HisH [Syntrophomonas palmitatica]|uniref:imidazole glycerol phosphate synthase subunit HisH n=1 Tax=Syntrophomonas palmitatica TaxID=402877 RepID=UPI0006D1ED00|nr:imidazole glycerol phosphate synthase subunit HisH [Syntrophomonas palmitatica]